MITTWARRIAQYGGALLVSVGAFGAFAAVAADSQRQTNIVVEAARPKVVAGHPDIPGRIVRVELRGEVSYADLDLSIDSNAKLLKERVQEAARMVCSDLDRMYHRYESAKDCASRAEHDAMPQVEAIIAAAQQKRAKK
jgi:UrcA family protein